MDNVETARLLQMGLLVTVIAGNLVSSYLCRGIAVDCSCMEVTNLMKDFEESCYVPSGIEDVIFDLSHNNITRTEGIQPHLLYTKCLDLSHNKISHLNGFSNLNEHVNLKLLNLSFNNIETLNTDKFVSVTSLIMIDLSHNHIGAVENNDFEFLSKLEYLNLSWNQLSSFHIRCPDVLTQLILNNNGMNEIDVDNRWTFRLLDLSCNNFTEIPIIDEQWRGEVLFGGNPSNCTDLLKAHVVCSCSDVAMTCNAGYGQENMLKTIEIVQEDTSPLQTKHPVTALDDDHTKFLTSTQREIAGRLPKITEPSLTYMNPFVTQNMWMGLLFLVVLLVVYRVTTLLFRRISCSSENAGMSCNVPLNTVSSGKSCKNVADLPEIRHSYHKSTVSFESEDYYEEIPEVVSPKDTYEVYIHE